jgi:hypothetical protein
VITFSKDTCNELIALYKTKKISLEGNILKVIKGGDAEFSKYIEEAKQRDNDTRRKRLEITKQVQQQNKDLTESQADRDKLMAELQVSLAESEKLKNAAVEDLETLQKRTQFELVGLIVKVALGVIGTVAFLTSILYFYVISKGLDAKIIESTWSNLFGILLTNSFSIIGTIMGVKYASGEKG